MFGISHLFNGIQNKHARELFLRQAIVAAVKEAAHVDISVDDLSFNGPTVILGKIRPAQKSEIFIKKEPILKLANEKQSIRKISDIR